MIQAYRAIAGACEFGTRNFCEGKALPSKLTVSEAIKLTAGQYGSDQFKGFSSREQTLIRPPIIRSETGERA